MTDFSVTRQDLTVAIRDQAVTAECSALLDSAIETANACFTPGCVKQVFNITRKDGVLLLAGTEVALLGTAIATHLDGCDEVVLFGVTAGKALDREIEKKRLTNLAEAYYLDLCGAVAAEKLAESAEAEIRKEAQARGKKCTARFSCGYGDFPLSQQRQFIELLKLDKLLGIRLTSGDMMVPTKSVTAVVGVGENAKYVQERCLACPKKKDCDGGLCRD